MLHTFPKTLSDIYSLPTEVSGVLYVGQSENLRRRFKEHAGAHPKNQRIRRFTEIFGRLRFSFCEVPPTTYLPCDAWLNSAEHLLVTLLNPPANSVIPTGQIVIGKIGTAVPAA